ncbi:MAG TPA: ABC transporter substrate-binding protein [Rectinemataceae bacterium]|nr:ABC transporter substrate-binding protein [Rectinemataceae bacterium]
MVKRSLVLLMALAMCLIVGVGLSAQKVYTIGFAQTGGNEGAWRDAETASVNAAAKEMGINLKFVDGQEKQDVQIAALRSFIAQKVDGILLAPVVATGWDDVLQECKDAHIPVVLLDRGIETSDDSLYVCKITSDFVAEGRRIGEWLIKKMGGKANIAELQGTPGADPAIMRQKGFAEAIAKVPGMKIVKSQTGNFNAADGKQVMEAFLKADKTINAVYAHNDDMALGAIQAIQEAGKKPGKDIIVVSIDGTKPAFQAMSKGLLNAVCECNPLLGKIGFETLIGAINGKSYPKWVIQSDGLYDMSQAAAMLPSRKY